MILQHDVRLPTHHFRYGFDVFLWGAVVPRVVLLRLCVGGRVRQALLFSRQERDDVVGTNLFVSCAPNQ
jgi:hypothetical protein